jgi:hypothetical protein
VGYRHLLTPAEAVVFLESKLVGHRGPIHGLPDSKRFEVFETALAPTLQVREEDGAWHLDVAFGAGERSADPKAVLETWRTGRTLVPLFEGGWARLPDDWLARHGALLRELLEARILRADYPAGYKPKRDTRQMVAFPQLAPHIDALAAYLK